jgi:hypothetical protein
LVCSAQAADFAFSATLRAGLPGNGEWEMGLGTDTNATQSTGQFRWSGNNPHWRDNDGLQSFRVGFTSATQTAYLTVWDSVNTPWTRTLVNAGTALRSNATWTFPTTNFFVSASNNSGAQPRSINVESLTLSPGVSVLSGSLPTSLGASLSSTYVAPMSTPLVINPASNGGDWYIDGTVRFSGLQGAGGNAARSQLQFFLRAEGTSSNNPEVQTFLLSGLGLTLVGVLGRMRRSRAS